MNETSGKIVRNTQSRQGKRRSAVNTHRYIGELMLRLGIEPHLVGYDPLCGGIRIAAERDRASCVPVSERTLTTVETLCDHVSQEHSMRDAIGAGFLNTDDIHARLFPFSDRPSNAEFIYTLAELVRDRIASERR